MAITLLNSQGTLMYILDATTADTIDQAVPATDITAIQGGDLVGCPQSIGSIEETRAMTEYTCISSDESIKALGSISRGNTVISLLFDPDDATGQAALKAAFADNTKVGIGIEFPNGTTNGTILYFEGVISAVSIGIEKDAAITYDVTVEISSEVHEYAAV